MGLRSPLRDCCTCQGSTEGWWQSNGKEGGDGAQGGRRKRWHLIRVAESEGWTLEVEGRTQQVAGMPWGRAVC